MVELLVRHQYESGGVILVTREALFLFCWAKVLGQTIFGSDNVNCWCWSTIGSSVGATNNC